MFIELDVLPFGSRTRQLEWRNHVLHSEFYPHIGSSLFIFMFMVCLWDCAFFVSWCKRIENSDVEEEVFIHVLPKTSCSDVLPSLVTCNCWSPREALPLKGLKGGVYTNIMADFLNLVEVETDRPKTSYHQLLRVLKMIIIFYKYIYLSV